MFSTMLSADPPVIYWRPETLSLLALLGELRSEGVRVWETMDAGPQVKLLIEEDTAPVVLERLRDRLPAAQPTLCSPGLGARLVTAEELTKTERNALGG